MLIGEAPAQATDNPETFSIPSPLRVFEIEHSQTGTALKLNAGTHSQLRQHSKVRLTDFPLSANKTVTLELERFTVTTASAVIVAGTMDGNVLKDVPDILLFRGRISTSEESRVVISSSPRGIYGIIQTDLQSYIYTPNHLSQNAHNSEDHVINTLSELERQAGFADEFNCGVRTGSAGLPELPELSEPIIRLPGQFQFCRLALECDYEFWQQFNNHDLALDYIFFLFGAINEIYQRDVSTKLALTFIRIWDHVNDPYSYVGGAITGLEEFRDYWKQNHNSGGPDFIERDLAHLLSSRGVGAWAWTGKLCNYESGYSISGGNAQGATPALSLIHDLYFVSHEIGHNFNAKHTHCFDPPLDQCSTEPGCNDTQDCSTATGTIMSYCHSCPGGYSNILHEFAPENITRMRSHIESSCIQLARNPSYVDRGNTSGIEDGTASNPYNTVKEGVESVLPAGTVRITNGNYDEQIIIWQPMTLESNGGTVVIGE